MSKRQKSMQASFSIKTPIEIVYNKKIVIVKHRQSDLDCTPPIAHELGHLNNRLIGELLLPGKEQQKTEHALERSYYLQLKSLFIFACGKFLLHTTRVGLSWRAGLYYLCVRVIGAREFSIVTARIRFVYFTSTVVTTGYCLVVATAIL